MPPVSEAQRRAMWAAAEGRSTLGIPKKVGKEFVAADAALPIAAGTVFVSPEGKVLLLKRGGEQGVDNYVGHWSLPGGKAEQGETPEQCADRECAEELGNTAPVSKKKLLDRVKTPNGMVFHTFAQPVHSEFQPQLNEEHTEHGWFAVNELPSPLHPSVGRVLRENLGVAEDMQPEDWSALRENFAKWTLEEEVEPEHKGEDNQPMAVTTANTGIPMAVAAKKKKIAVDALCYSCVGNGCKKCGGSGVAPVTDTRKKSRVLPGSMATKAMRSKSVAFDMALWLRGLGNLASDEGFNEADHPRADNGQFGSGGSGGGTKVQHSVGSVGGAKKETKAPLKMSSLKKTGGKMGSNEGGVYEGEAGKFYVKKPASKDHVRNERAAARLYQLAGVNTLDYRDVEGGEHVATELKKLEKKNIKDFTPAERKEAANDFAIHAWLSNWDAAGMGGDNQGILNGKVTTLDVGGSLRYRAQGGPKGGAFGDKVTEFDTLRDKGMNPDAAALFAPMSKDELRASVERVSAIPDAKIRATVGDDKELADRLIARKKDLAAKVGLGGKMAKDSLAPMVELWNRRAEADAAREKQENACQMCGGTGEVAGPGCACDECGGTGLIAEDARLLAFDYAMVMGLHRDGLAFDTASASVRTIDLDGRMHVEVSNISKATVNPYMGKEIPKWKSLGLLPDKIYHLLRDPAEIAKAVPTFNNLPLLDRHIGVNAANHHPEYVVGSTGTDAEFEHPYLKNSLVVWADKGINAIESKKKKELSSAYRYRADMTPGDYEGVRYDGVMRDLIGNHVALVEEGRAGSDVVVGDSANPLIKEKTMIKKAKLSALGTVAYGALSMFLKPQLAEDAQIDLRRGLKNINAKNFKAKREVLAAWINESVKDKLDPQFATDGALNADGLETVLDQIELACDDFPDDLKKEDKKPKAEDADMDDEDADMSADDAETDEEKAARMAAREKAKDKKAKDAKKAGDKKAKDADVNEKDEEHDPETPKKMGDDEDVDDEEKEAAMDAQIERRVEAGIQKERERMEAVTAAKEHVRSRVGNITIASDTAAGVYRKALKIATGKEPPKNADADTLKYAFDSLPPKGGNNGRHRETYAMDSAPKGGAVAAIAERSESGKSLAANLSRIGSA